jgi:predicted nucleic acid-binding protein
MITAIADTSFVVAVGNRADANHRICTQVFHQQSAICLPQSVFAEVGYMLGRAIGKRALAGFLRQLPQTRYRIIPLEAEDLTRTADLLDQYHDTRLDFVDASIVAIAERLSITRILTLDQRDFRLVRPRHIEYLELHPSQNQ